MSQSVEYLINLTRTGAGGPEAVADLKAVATQAAATGAAMNGMSAVASTATANLGSTAKQATAGLKGLSTAVILLGGTEFPHLAIGASAVSQGLKAVQASGIAVQAGLGLTSAGIAGVVAMLISAVYWWEAYAAESFEAVTKEDLAGQTAAFTANLREQINAMRDNGDITARVAEERLRDLRTATEAGNQAARDFIRNTAAGTAAEALAHQAKNAQIADLNLEAAGNLTHAESIAHVNQAYTAQLNLIRSLREAQLITTKEEEDLNLDAVIKKLSSLKAVQKEVTDLQTLEQHAATEFASGFSTAIVDVIAHGKSFGLAMQEMFSQLLADIAQAIMQMLIMRALFGATGAASGTGGLIGGLFNTAAAGGQFNLAGARLMAGGGMAELSSPTYFPRFNVIAGEAGREVMTVMARPHMMSIGGIAAQVGDVGPNRMAITNAADLMARAGGGAHLDVRIHLDEHLEGQIIGKAANVSVQMVTTKMTQRGPLSENTKRLINQ